MCAAVAAAGRAGFAESETTSFRGSLLSRRTGHEEPLSQAHGFRHSVSLSLDHVPPKAGNGVAMALLINQRKQDMEHQRSQRNQVCRISPGRIHFRYGLGLWITRL